MSSEYQWFMEDRIILALVFEEVTLEDLHKGNTEITRMLNESKGSVVHLLFDTTHVQKISIGLNPIRRVLRYFQHQKLGWVVAFGSVGFVARLIEFLGSVISKITGVRIAFTETRSEAIRYLQEHDATLPDLSMFV